MEPELARADDPLAGSDRPRAVQAGTVEAGLDGTPGGETGAEDIGVTDVLCAGAADLAPVEATAHG
jgi:hypothetical protein